MLSVGESAIVKKARFATRSFLSKDDTDWLARMYLVKDNVLLSSMFSESRTISTGWLRSETTAMGAGRASRKKNPGGNRGHREQKLVAMEHSAKKKQKRRRLQSTREHLDRDELVGILYESAMGNSPNHLCHLGQQKTIVSVS